METIQGSEWAVFASMMFQLLLATGTKVEESFNVQATHDIIYHTYNLSAYDHNIFPGVVPRTFAGPIYLSLFGLPMRFFLGFTEIPKFWMLTFIRLVLGCSVVLGFLNLARCIEKHFGHETATAFRWIVACQFHFLFYASRPLPNTFALILVLVVYQRWLDGRMESAVRWATVATLIFRCELVLLFAPLFIPSIINGKLPLFGVNGAIFIGIKTALKVLAVTVPLDSLLWGRIVWPEAEVAWFNIFMNKSHEYGVSHFLWYFYSALPRALMTSFLLIPIGLLLDRRLFSIIFPIVVFIGLYSFLPHKELRFIIYSFPILSLPAAVVYARMYINKDKSWARLALYYGCLAALIVNILGGSLLLYAAARNYPGSDVIKHLQFTQRFDRNKPMTVYIDNACAQTGVNRFTELFDAWEYNKTEHLKPEDLERFDFLLLGTYGDDLKDTVMSKYTKWHKVMFAIRGFHAMKWVRLSSFPFILPEIIDTEKAVALRRKDYR